MNTLKLVTPPVLDIVPLAEMKTHLRVNHGEEDALITGLTKGAIAHLDGREGVLGWCLGIQTWVQVFDAFPPGPIRLGIGPLVDVVSVEYADAGAAYQTLDPAEYHVDAIASPGWIVPATDWPSVEGTNAVRITFRAGHETVDEIHSAIPVIIKLLVGHWYENREAVGPNMAELPLAVGALISAHRRLTL